MAKSIVDPGNARSRRTRAALLAATREILEAEGFEGLSMQAVAERAGVTRRSVYLHFSTRQELVGSLFAYVSDHERLTDSLDRIWACTDARSALDEFAEHLVRFHTRVLVIDRAADRVLGSDPDAARFREVIAADQRAVCRRLAEWLRREGRLGEAWSVADAADLMWGLMAPQLLERLVVGRKWSKRRLAGHLRRVLAGALLSEPGEGPPR